MNYYDFTNQGNWRGGYYELSMEYYPAGDDKRVSEPLVSLMNSGFFGGIW